MPDKSVYLGRIVPNVNVVGEQSGSVGPESLTDICVSLQAEKKDKEKQVRSSLSVLQLYFQVKSALISFS